eukprot:scaffold239031_cov36-Prasinocladus_malaysianus.AAC.1
MAPVGLGACREELSDDAEVAVEGRLAERRHSEGVGPVGVGPGGQQDGHRLAGGVARDGGQQRRDALHVAPVGVGFVLHQHADGLDVAALAGHPQRR